MSDDAERAEFSEFVEAWRQAEIESHNGSVWEPVIILAATLYERHQEDWDAYQDGIGVPRPAGRGRRSHGVFHRIVKHAASLSRNEPPDKSMISRVATVLSEWKRSNDDGRPADEVIGAEELSGWLEGWGGPWEVYDARVRRSGAGKAKRKPRPQPAKVVLALKDYPGLDAELPELDIIIERAGMAPLEVTLPAGDPATAIKLLVEKLAGYATETQAEVNAEPAAGRSSIVTW